MISLTFGLFTQVSGSGPLGPLVCHHILLFTCDQHVISMCCQNIVMSHLVLIDSVCVTLISPNSIA